MVGNQRSAVRVIDIIVINWNSCKKTVEALLPYFRYSSDSIRCNVVIVDNASSDYSLELLEKTSDKLIINDKNLGFATACNQAMAAGDGDYILLLNPDTISQSKTLENLVKILEEDEQIGVVGPQQRNEDHTIKPSCGRFPTFWTSVYEITGLSKIFPSYFHPTPIMLEWDHKTDKFVDHIIGSYYLMRRFPAKELNCMDEKFFVYHEDLDLSKRIKKSGYSIFFSADNFILHEGGGTGNEMMSERLFYSLRSRQYYWTKHLGRGQSAFLGCLTFLVELPLRILNVAVGTSKVSGKDICKAHLLFAKSFLTQQKRQ